MQLTGSLSLTARCLVGLFVGFALLVAAGCQQHVEKPSLLLYCAAGLREPMEALAESYKEEQGGRVELQFGGSNTLLNQLEISRTGDLYLAADASYIKTAQERGLTGEAFTIATMAPVIVVNRKAIDRVKGISDLARDDVRVAFADPDAAAIGKVTKEILEEAGIWASVEQRVRQSGVFPPTVNGVASAVSLGSVDAGLIWDALASNYPELEVVQAPELKKGRAQIEIAVLKSSQHPEEATEFARYVTSPDAGKRIFADHGFDTSTSGQESKEQAE